MEHEDTYLATGYRGNDWDSSRIKKEGEAGERKLNKIFSGDCLFVMRHNILEESV